MKWEKRPSRIKAWIDEYRQENWDGDSQLILAILPKSESYSGGTTYWLCPVVRTRHVTVSDGTNIFGGETLHFFSYYDYSEPNEKEPWKTWAKARAMHHLAGLVYFGVYHLWAVALALFIVSPIWGKILFGFNPMKDLLDLLFH